MLTSSMNHGRKEVSYAEITGLREWGARRMNCRSRGPIGPTIALFLGFFAHAECVKAQDIGTEGTVSVQRLDYAQGPNNLNSTRTSRIEDKNSWWAGGAISYVYQPFSVLRCRSSDGDVTACSPDEDPTELKVVESLAELKLMASYVPVSNLQISTKLPIAYVKGEGSTGIPGSVVGQPSLQLSPINQVSLGDWVTEAKYRFYGDLHSKWGFATTAYFGLPLANWTNPTIYLGDSSVSAGFKAVADARFGPFQVAANLGAHFRETARVGSSYLGSEMRYSLAGAYVPLKELSVGLDLFGSTNFSTQAGTSALEIDAFLNVFIPKSQFTFSLVGGTGIVRGIGAPALRVLAALSYSQAPRDSDGDGIDDRYDNCPTEAEDKDGFEDSDGCPELDNDQDGIPDTKDACPDLAEDIDGFEDEDGCPDLDNDKDGIVDAQDECPNEPETENGYLDFDGCPDAPDADHDGVPDEEDQCPNDPEDRDGFMDGDGCPDADNDEDGIPDAQDKCPNEPETVNGKDDTDGCPD